MSREAPDTPGTLTALIEEVVRGTPAPEGDGAWGGALKPGLVVGRYELLREVGRGGFGVVWEARDRDLGRTVAFKALRARGEPAREKRLLAEAEVAARLSHPNVVTVLDVGRSEHGVYLVQEFLSGAPLSRRLAEGKLPVREAVRIGLALARGLAHAHAHGVVHRDLTPGNVQLLDDGQVKLLDLGMAGALGRRKLEGGTPAYMAPEQAAGEPEDERTDVYALGVLLYRMLTGQAPVDVDARGAPRSASRGLAVPEAPALAALVEAMLARKPAERPRDAGVVAEALAEVEHTLPLGTAPSRVKVRRAPRVRWVVGGLLAVSLAAALSTALGTRGRSALAARTEPIVLAADSTRTPCNWTPIYLPAADGSASGAVVRNGDYRQQERARVYDRPAWVQRSDWNQLFIRLPDEALELDVFALQVDFLAEPAGDFRRLLSAVVFVDPAGPDPSDTIHGVGLALEDRRGTHSTFTWGSVSGRTHYRPAYSGSVASAFTATWKRLRIEGSRRGCWFRALVDGVPLLWAQGGCDLAGRHLLLWSAGESYRSADVAWRDAVLFRGDDRCK